MKQIEQAERLLDREIAQEGLHVTDDLRSRIEKISTRLSNDNDGHWAVTWLKDPYLEDHLANIEGYLELYERELEYSAKVMFQAKQILEEVLTVREMGPSGPLKTKIREFLESISRE